jgi:hypothetical protein
LRVSACSGSWERRLGSSIGRGNLCHPSSTRECRVVGHVVVVVNSRRVGAEGKIFQARSALAPPNRTAPLLTSKARQQVPPFKLFYSCNLDDSAVVDGTSWTTIDPQLDDYCSSLTIIGQSYYSHYFVDRFLLYRL